MTDTLQTREAMLNPLTDQTPPTREERVSFLERLHLWFFRDLGDAERMKLFELWLGKEAAAEATSSELQSHLLRLAFSDQENDGVGWQGIESAPKDGTMILLASGRHVFPGWWDESNRGYPWIIVDETARCQSEGGQTAALANAAMDEYPSHWMPLPAAPASGGEG